MILENFKLGWREKFEYKIQFLFNKLPGIELESAVRHEGMLRITIRALDKDTQFIVDCVTHMIERNSVRTCECCGEYGTRRYNLLSEPMCLCLPCYTLLVDGTLS